MPASYAHHRFGELAFPMLSSPMRKKIQRFRQLYDVGQHGPDFFFYFQPLFHTKMGELGGKYHAMTGKEFFEAAAARLKESTSEGAEVYLYGVLGHFALDSACHPLVRTVAAEGKIGHTELETEFDRHLLTIDGKEPAHLQNLGKHMRLTWGECVTASEFYPPASAYTVRRSVRTMAIVNRMLAMHNRKLVESLLSMGGSEASQMLMYPRANHKCAQLLQPLNDLFDESLAQYPAMADQLTAHIRDGAPLGAAFEKSFG